MTERNGISWNPRLRLAENWAQAVTPSAASPAGDSYSGSLGTQMSATWVSDLSLAAVGKQSALLTKLEASEVSPSRARR